MKNLTQILVERLTTPKSVVTVGEFEFDIIALRGDAKQMVETAQDSLMKYKNAAIYGLCFGGRPIMEMKDATVEDVHAIFSEDGLPDDVITTVAEEVLMLSDMEDELNSEDDDIQEEVTQLEYRA